MDGLVTMTPSSASGLISTSPDNPAGDDDTQPSFVKVNANGGVDFQNVVSLSLNGVFKSGADGFDNYVIVWTGWDGSDQAVRWRWRKGTAPDADAIGSDYVQQSLNADGGTVNGNREDPPVNYAASVRASRILTGSEIHVYGPALPQPTAYRVVQVVEKLNARILDMAGTHSLGESYDGITFWPSGGGGTIGNPFTGNLIVMGYAE